MDLHRGAGIGQHLAQAVDIDFDGVRADVARQAEQVVLEQPLGRHVAAAPQQDLEHRGLARGEGAHGVADDDLSALGVERDVAEGEAAAEQVVGPAQQRLQAGDELLHGERLGHVVVGALAQAGDAVGDAVARRQHQHGRRIAAPAHVAQQAERRPRRAARGRAPQRHSGWWRGRARHRLHCPMKSVENPPRFRFLIEQGDQLLVILDDERLHRHVPPNLIPRSMPECAGSRRETERREHNHSAPSHLLETYAPGGFAAALAAPAPASLSNCFRNGLWRCRGALAKVPSLKSIEASAAIRWLAGVPLRSVTDRSVIVASRAQAFL